MTTFIATQEPPQEPQVMRPPSFFSQLPSAFAYPLRRSASLMTIFGSIFLGLSCLVLLLGLYFAPFGLVLTVATFPCFGYLYAFLVKIINTTVNGQDEMPEWPINLAHMATTFVTIIFTVLVTFLPAILYLALCLNWDLSLKPLIFFGYCGLFVFPMAILRVSLFDSIQAFEYGSIFRSIGKAPTAYVFTFLLLLVLFLLSTWLLLTLKSVLVIGFPLATVVAFYLAMVEARILGLLFRTYRYSYDWY